MNKARARDRLSIRRYVVFEAGWHRRWIDNAWTVETGRLHWDLGTVEYALAEDPSVRIPRSLRRYIPTPTPEL